MSKLFSAFVVVTALAAAGASPLPAAAADSPPSATVGVAFETEPDDNLVVRLTYRAGAGQENNVEIEDAYPRESPAPFPWTIRETGHDATTGEAIVLVAGNRCRNVDASTVTCDPSVSESGVIVDVELGDGADRADLETACGAEDIYDNFWCWSILKGGAGADHLRGADYYYQEWVNYNFVLGGPGDDVLIARSSDAGGESGFSREGAMTTLVGNAGNDTLIGGFFPEALFGGTGADMLYGRGGRDTIFGGRGGDLLVGNSQGDVLSGDRGHDKLRADAGRDALYTRDGVRDVLMGGKGRDRARVDHVDRLRYVEGSISARPSCKTVWTFYRCASDAYLLRLR